MPRWDSLLYRAYAMFSSLHQEEIAERTGHARVAR